MVALVKMLFYFMYDVNNTLIDYDKLNYDVKLKKQKQPKEDE